jgi:4-hydroxybutyrate dehydrogenase
MRLVKDCLPRAFATPGDMEARANMMSAAMMGAVAFQKGLGAIHALSHPLGAHYNTHHGTTNAVCMPAVLAFNRPAIEDRFERLAAYLGIAGGFEGFARYVEELNATLGIPGRMKALGVEDADVDRLVQDALRDPSTGGNPVPLTEDSVRELYLRVL